MTLDEIYQELTNLVNCGDQTISDAANFVGQVTTQAHQGQMSPAELTETLQDVQRQIQIIQDMNSLEFKEKLNTLINGIITIASAVA
jgi:membrane-bound lytic murein transglycosylase B